MPTPMVPVPMMPVLVNPMVKALTVMTVPMSVMVVQIPMMPMMVNGVPDGSVSLGASLRDRATLPSPLRGLGPSGGYPSRLRSLALAARSACPAARCGDRRGLLATALRATLVAVLASLALAGCAGCGHRLGSSRRHFVPRRCRLRRPPARAPPGASPAPLVRALLRSERAPCSASRRAVVPRTTPCSNRCTSRRSIAAAAPMNRRRRRRFPELRCCRLAVPDRPGRPWFSHLTHR